MAVFNKVILAAAALATFVVAAPVEKRHLVIVTETDWTTVEVTTTLVGSAEPTELPATTTVPAAVVTSSSVVAPSVASVITPVIAQVSTAAVAPAVTSVVTPATSAASIPAPVSTVALQQKDTAATGPCVGEGSGCVGDVTHWDGGLGACGWTVDSNSELQIALPVGLMGSLSNTNPYCGMSVTIYNPIDDKTQVATVGDKCMGCLGNSIDLTNALFAAVAPSGDGRVSGVQWWFN